MPTAWEGASESEKASSSRASSRAGEEARSSGRGGRTTTSEAGGEYVKPADIPQTMPVPMGPAMLTPPVTLEPVDPNNTTGRDPRTGLPFVTVDDAEAHRKQQVDYQKKFTETAAKEVETGWWERFVRATVGGAGRVAAGVATTPAGPLAQGAAVSAAPAFTDWLMDKFFGTAEEKAANRAKVQQYVDDSLEESGGNNKLAYEKLKAKLGQHVPIPPEKSTSSDGKSPGGAPPPGTKSTEIRENDPTLKNQAGTTATGTTTTVTPAPMGKAITVAQQEAIRQSELEKFAQSKAGQAANMNTLVQSYNKNADLRQYTPIDISVAKNPTEAEQIKRYNDLIAASARSQAIADQATSAISSAPKPTDAWSQYYKPDSYQAQAAQAQAAQSQYTNVAPAQTISGNYQADLSDLQRYDSQIATSEARANSLDAMNMTQRRAQGLEPSVAELSYRQNLDALAAQQAAAQATQRGPGAAAGQEALMNQAASMGQKAVNEIASARAQEQQAAETAYAAQANQIMIEDQKKAASEKTNELQQLVNITQGKISNAKNVLDADKFNADAINAVNNLQATLSQQTANLNAQLANNVNIQNASAQNSTNLQNAMQALEASKYAGDKAQNLSNLIATTARSDAKDISELQSLANSDNLAVRKAVANAMATLGMNQATIKNNEQNVNDIRTRWGISRDDAIAAAKAAEKHGVDLAYLNLSKSIVDEIRNKSGGDFGKEMEKYIISKKEEE